jgi:hypothetical protein
MSLKSCRGIIFWRIDQLKSGYIHQKNALGIAAGYVTPSLPNKLLANSNILFCCILGEQTGIKVYLQLFIANIVFSKEVLELFFS